MKRPVVVMDVSGCGSSTVGAAVAKRAGLRLSDGAGLHPQANIDQMARAIG